MKRQTFYASRRVGSDYEYVPVPGYEFSIDGNSQRFFLTRAPDGDYWDALEMTTGSKVSPMHEMPKTRQEAIEATCVYLRGKEARLASLIECHVNRYGVSPAVKEN